MSLNHSNDSVAENRIPSAMAIFSGGPAHLQQEVALLPMLCRMGLESGEAATATLGGRDVRRYPISYGGRPMELLQFDCDAAMALQFSGRHPGAIEKQFVPRPGAMFALRWDDSETPPRQMIDDILATIGVLCAFLHPAHVLWKPARIWTHSPALANSIEKYFDGELLPVMRLVTFVPVENRVGSLVRTEGLAPFTGQELEALSEHRNTAETIRRLARLALDMFDHGAINREVTIDGLQPGEHIMLRPRLRSDVVDVDITNDPVDRK